MTNYGTARLKVDAVLHIGIIYACDGVHDGTKTIRLTN